MKAEDTGTKAEPPQQQLATIEKIKRAIWMRRPILGEIMEKHGSKTLYSYSQDFMDVNKSPLLDARKPELIKTAGELIEKRLGKEVADRMIKQLTKLPVVSTADHHGPIDHPFWVNANIISAIPYIEENDPDINSLVVFSFASVSVNNASAYPRGIIFHGDSEKNAAITRLPILPDKMKMGVVYGMRPFNREDLSKAESELTKKAKKGEVVEGRSAKILNLLETYAGTEQVLTAPDLASQITEINYNLWPKLFHERLNSGQATTVRIPDLIYLEIETLVTELLLKYHLNNPKSLIYKLLFDPVCQKLSLKYFNNLAGAFSLENGWGTFFFWGVDDKFHRLRLELKDGGLYCKENQLHYKVDPEGITRALKEKKIFPSMLTCYLLVSLYYGMKCLGGFCQVHDLSVIKKAWGELLKEIGEPEQAAALEPVQTKELGGDGMVLAYLKMANGAITPATGIDMAIDPIDTRFESYVELSKQVTLSEMMNSMLPEMYTVLYASHQRDPNLMTITPEQIMKITGVEKKLSEHIV